MDNLSKAKEEVTRFCEHIGGWFRGEEGIAAAGTAGLLTNFSPDFRMIAPNGARKTQQDLEAWMPEVLGRFPHMRVIVTDMQGYATEHHALLTYTEIQSDGEQENIRYSSAVFIRDGDRMLWLDLWERS
ncbi:hypothetical protein [Chitinophaga qingshengii]|uniref:Nuclear transport factor 2 family protein n=1 Tax=Chitinophaga qingshengii TaxID=1569794 RepID=A0ABR7TVK1_9BACT|nr:hypothetical protein [Chitinophaga qingshengii]MBC9934516.1 hypothetical protein [Chitinophaga qingshengii]